MPIIEISSFEDARLDAYTRLTEAQLRNRLEPEKGIFIAESKKVIERALAAGYEARSLLVVPKWLDEAMRIVSALDGDIPVFVAPAEVLEYLIGFELTRGMLAEMKRPVLPEVASLVQQADRIAVLDGIVDHTNVGAIFRSAAALGIDAVLVTPTCCDPLYRRAVRVSMGTVFQVPWTRIGKVAGDWPDAGIAELKAFGYTIASFALTADAIALDDPHLRSCDRLAMVFGTEGDGLAASTLALSDFRVRIPMANQVDSLNVAAASAVAFWELCKGS